MARRQRTNELDAEFWKRVKAAQRRNEKQARRLLSRLHQLEPDVADEFHAVGCVLADLSEARIYKALGYATFADCLRGEELFSKATAYKLMAVARTYSEDLAFELGFEKAYAVIGWAREADQDPARVAARDARIGGRRISDQSVRRIVAETRKLARTGAGADPGAREAARSAKLLAKALRARGARRVQVTPRKHKDGWHLIVDVRVKDAGRIT